MTTLYKVCKRTIERAIENGTIDEIREDMQGKIDLYSAAGKITLEEYEELSAMLKPEENPEPEPQAEPEPDPEASES